MFPLGTVLMPSMVLPLHIFEERYRAMVRHCLDGDQSFGVVLIARGHEVGGGDQRNEVGCVARIVEVGEFPDGRFALTAVGTAPIEVVEWLPDDPFPRALVDHKEQSPAHDDLAERHTENVTLLRRVLALRGELGDAVAPATVELSDDLLIGGFQAAALSPFGPADHQRLLAAPGPSERAALLHHLLAEERAMVALRMAELGMQAEDQ